MTELVGRNFEFEVEGELDLVWQALTTSEGLATWYVDHAEVDARPGGELKVDWGAGPHAMGTYEIVDAPRHLKLVYGGGQVGAEEWLLSHDDGVTHVRLIHSLPVEEGASWDDLYGDITRGWSLFMGTLAWVGATIGRVGRQTEVRIGSIADGAWHRVSAALGVDTSPSTGDTLTLPDVPPAEVLVAHDGLSLLLAFDDRATLLVDVEGDSLYTVSATYGVQEDDHAALLGEIANLAQRLCDAAGEQPG